MRRTNAGQAPDAPRSPARSVASPRLPAVQGIHIASHGGVLRDVAIERVTIERPRTHGVYVAAGAAGRATFRDVAVTGAGAAGLHNEAAATFTVDDGGGNRW